MRHEPGAVAPDPVTPSGTELLLLVEDDEADAFLVTELMTEAGLPWRVQRARSVKEALELIDPRTSCILLDLGLPDATGMEALHAVLDAAGPAAVVCLTGLDDEDRGAAAVAAGAQDYLVKGKVDAELLQRALRYAVERRRAEDQARQLYATELQAAENARLERGLLPRPSTTDRLLAVTTRYRPGRAALLGGDFFDVVECTDGTLYAIIGDVAGHGPDEAALGVCLRIAWRTLVLSGSPPERLLPILEAVLAGERRSEEVFTTACMVVVPPSRDHADVWLAGHHPPLLVHDGPSQLAPRDHGPALGVLPDATWRPQRVELPDRWRLVLFTDGWIEARVGPGSERLGVRGLLRMIEESPEQWTAAELLDDLLSAVQEVNGGPLSDDVAVVALEWPEPRGEGGS